MVFWIIAVALAALTVAILVLSAMRGRDEAEPAAAYDLRVYRDQLREVDRDLARGVIAEADADRIRTEISRRVLAADAQMKADDSAETKGRSDQARMGVILAVCLAMAGGSLWLYAQIGQPGYSDLPRALREAVAAEARENRPSQAVAEADFTAPPLNPVTDEYRDLVQRLRDTVASRPDDLEGLILLARNEAVLGDFKAAYQAQAEILRIKGDAASGRDYLNYADMMILAAGGYVSPEAEAALTEALKLEPTNSAAQYYYGLMYAQTGRPDLTFRIWSRLLAAGPPNAAWIAPIRGQIEDIAALAGETRFTLPPLPGEGTPDQTAPGPSAEDIEAASEMSEADRQAMIKGMVEGLAQRLAEDGGTADEWARLIRALGILGDLDRAKAIYQEALNVFAADAASIARVQAAAADVGVDE